MDVKKIGKFIALNRKKKGLTQELLGEKLGVSNKTVSRWENGNYMPDLSLLEPLSKELDITLNELLAGEYIEKEKAAEESEKNLADAVDYSARIIQNEHKKISTLIMCAGVILVICAFSGVIKKLLVSAGVFVVSLSIFFLIDYVGVTAHSRPPIYRYVTETCMSENDVMTVYHNPFYNVYRINVDTPNEYYIIDTGKKYNLDTVPISPFNREKSGIDSISKYKSSYIGDNSNTGALVSALPLSEYGYVFEIDAENYGLIIDYHFTDWYGSDDLYVEKSLLYNSVSIFTLIDNVQYITYHFSGSSYTITRNDIEKSYPDYDKIADGNQIHADNFNQYVEKKMNDETFVEKLVWSIFAKLDI